MTESRKPPTALSKERRDELMAAVRPDSTPMLAWSCQGYVPMAGFGETRCKRCGIPLDRHPVVAQ